MKKLWLMILVTVLVSACAAAGGGSSKLDIKIAGKDSTLNVKSGGVYYGNVISTAPGKPNVQTFAHDIYLANYELDTTSGVTMRKPLTAADQMRVELQLTGEDGTKTDSPFKVATYTARADKFNRVRSVIIVTFADGKETKTVFDTMGLTPKTDGEVKLTAVTADSISGEVNLTDGDKSIKGNFTAKLPKAK
jgi:hypothetical protein